MNFKSKFVPVVAASAVLFGGFGLGGCDNTAPVQKQAEREKYWQERDQKEQDRKEWHNRVLAESLGSEFVSKEVGVYDGRYTNYSQMAVYQGSDGELHFAQFSQGRKYNKPLFHSSQSFVQVATNRQWFQSNLDFYNNVQVYFNGKNPGAMAKIDKAVIDAGLMPKRDTVSIQNAAAVKNQMVR